MNKTPALLLLCLLLAGPLVGADEAETQFNFATGLLIKNEHALAADEFEALLRKHPGFAQADVACYRLGEARQKAGQAEAAQQAFERLLKEFPASERAPQAHYWLGQLMAKADPAAAAAHYAAILEKWPDNPIAEAAAYGAAENHFKAGNWAAAIASCDALLKRFPGGGQAPNALYTRGWAAFQAQQWELARASFEELLKRSPESPLAEVARGKTAESLHRLGRFDEALARYAELSPRDSETGRAAAIGRATLLFERGDARAAAQAFEEVAGRLAGDARRPACLLNAGHAWFATNDFARAAAAFDLLTHEHPQDTLAPVAGYWLGQAQLRSGDAAKAVATLAPLLGQAALQEAHGFDIRLILAEAQMARQAYAEAAQAYAAARQSQPDHRLAPEAWMGELAALEKAGRLDVAEQTAAAFLAALPNHARAAEMRFWLGEFRFRRQAYAEADEALAAFLGASPKHALAPEALYKRGWCARHGGKHEAAGAHFKALFTQWPKHPLAAEAALRAGQAAEARQQQAEALDAYRQARALAPDSEAAEQAWMAGTVILLGQGAAPEALAMAADFVAQRPKSPLLPYAQLYRAEALSQLKRLDESLQAYQSPALQQEATVQEATFGAAWCLDQLQRPAEAAAAYEKVAAADKGRAAEAAYLAARAREQAKEYDRARQAYAQLAASEAQPPARRDEAAYREAHCAWQAKDAEGAVRGYTALLAQRAGSPLAAQALYDLAWVLLEQEKQADAEARFQELATRFPTNALAADVQFRLGELAYARSDFAAAASAYEAALKHPGLTFAGEVRYKLGWTYEQLKRPDDAIACFARLAETDPKGERAPEARYRQARLLQEAGRHDQALAVLAGIQEGAFAEHAALLKAESLRATNRQREALEAYDHLLKTWPEGSFRLAAQLGRAHSLRAVGAHRDALEAYAAVAAAAPGESAAQATLGQGYCHFALQQWDEAAKAFLKVDILYGYEKLKKEALTQLVQTWEKAGDADKAARYRNELAQRYPEKP
jgi:TolA-binding protein